MGCGQKAAGLDDPKGFSSFRNVWLFSQSLTFTPWNCSDFCRFCHTDCEAKVDFMVKMTKSQAFITLIEHLWRKKPVSPLLWCLWQSGLLARNLQQGMAHLKADLFKTHEHQKKNKKKTNTGSIWFVLFSVQGWNLKTKLVRDWQGWNQSYKYILKSCSAKKENQELKLVAIKNQNKVWLWKARGVCFGYTILVFQNVERPCVFHEEALQTAEVTQICWPTLVLTLEPWQGTQQ